MYTSVKALQQMKPSKQNMHLKKEKIGVKIQKYHADNGAFDTRVFKEIIVAENQTIYFSGVDAHHQNVIAECMIKTVTYCARSILLNEMICWIYIITTELCPYAIKLSIDVSNNRPGESGITAL